MSFDKPYSFFLRTIILLGVIGAFMPKETFEIQWHDTYFVIAFWHALLALFFYFGVNMGLYWMVKNRKLVRWMTLFHLITTAIFILCFIIFGYTNNKYLIMDFCSTYPSRFQQVFVYSILLFLLSQLIFLLNLLISLLRKTSP